MSVEGVPSVGDVAVAVRGSLHGPSVDCRGLTAFGAVKARENVQARRIAVAVHALYAPVLERLRNNAVQWEACANDHRKQGLKLYADAARHREALDGLELHDRTGDPYDEGYSAALADLRAALVDPKGQD